MTRLIAWHTNGKISYRIIAENGKTLINSNQGFVRKSGLIKNIRAVADFFAPDYGIAAITIHWTKTSRSKVIIKTETVNL